jgi:L-aspartate oxidase
MAGGLDPRVQPIPVAPAAHYHMGGVVTDASAQTSVEGLYAAGECASTGVHGANRLASNSLLEAAVFGTRAGEAARGAQDVTSKPLRAQPAPELPEDAVDFLRAVMSREAGVVRDAAGLSRLVTHIDQLEAEHGPALALVAARLVALPALAREESRGAHWRSDHLETLPVGKRTFVTLAEIGDRYDFRPNASRDADVAGKSYLSPISPAAE